MSIIGSDGLSVWVGDGGAPETFLVLKGASLSRLEITQKRNESTALSSDAWTVNAGMSGRMAVLECTAMATDEAASVRLRAITLTGSTGNFRLKLNTSETLSFAGVITRYREVIEAGAVKTLFLRLESSGALTIGS